MDYPVDDLKLVVLNIGYAVHDKDWNWRLQHGVLCCESMLSWAKGTAWTGDGAYLVSPVQQFRNDIPADSAAGCLRAA